MQKLSLSEIDKQTALLLSTEQMEYFGAVLIKKEGERLIVGVNKGFKYEDFLVQYFKDEVLEFKEIDKNIFDEALSWLRLEERLLQCLRQVFDEINKESSSDDSGILELIKLILQEAVSKLASDIHFEKDLKRCCVRFRIDGVLVERFSFDEWIFPPLSSSLKLLSSLKITETKKPQDGRFALEFFKNGDKHIFDFRVSVLPLIDGESIVLRILDKQKTLMPLETLGFLPSQMEGIERLFNLPYGLVFITGPTGSGKSTTMYGILNIIKDRNLKIITLEDPIEYRLSGISQVAVNKNIPFVSVLRNILRQDPDIIVLGEVRDQESLQIAIQAAFTGHLVFATLHTNDSLDTIVRLLDMGIDPYFIAQSLSGVVAQRLLRKLCECKFLENGKYVAGGCDLCNYTGYRGREAIAEIVEMDHDLEKFIYQKITKEETLRILEKRNPDFSLYNQGLQKVRRGLTDLREVYRVVK